MAASPCFCRRRSGGSLLVGSDRRVRGAVDEARVRHLDSPIGGGGLVGVGCDWPPRPAGLRGDWNGIRTRLSRVRRSSRRIWGLIPPVSVTREERNGWLRRFFNPAMSTLPTARSPRWAGSAMLGEYHDAGGGVASASGGRQISPPSVPVQTPHRRGAPTPTGQPTPVAPPRQRYSGRSGIDAWCLPLPRNSGGSLGYRALRSGSGRLTDLREAQKTTGGEAGSCMVHPSNSLSCIGLSKEKRVAQELSTKGSKKLSKKSSLYLANGSIRIPRQGACPKRLGESRSARVPSGTEEGSRRRKEAVPEHRQRKDQEILDCGRLSDSTVKHEDSRRRAVSSVSVG